MRTGLIEGWTYSIEDIKEALKEEIIKEIRLEYIWCNKCEICGETITTYDEEYSLDIIKKDGITEEFLEEELKGFEEDYFDIDRKEEQYELVLEREETKELIFYKYKWDYTDKDRCHICKDLI